MEGEGMGEQSFQGVEERGEERQAGRGMEWNGSVGSEDKRGEVKYKEVRRC